MISYRKEYFMASIWTAVTTNAKAVLTLISDLFGSVVQMFITNEGLTSLGMIVIIPLSIGVVIWAIYFVFGLINRIKIGRRG